MLKIVPAFLLLSTSLGASLASQTAGSAAQQPAFLQETFNRAVELQRRGDLKGAEAAYRSLLAQAPNHGEAHANLGALLMRLNRYEEAVASYEQALRVAPSLTPVLLNLGIAHYRRGFFEQAVVSFQKFLEHNPGQVQALQLAGLSLVELGRDSEAVNMLGKALAAAPSEPAVLYGLGLAYLRLNRPEVRDMMDRLAAAPGGLAASHLLRGQHYLARSEYERANAELEAARKIDPNLPRLNYSVGLSLLKSGRNQEALAAFQKELQQRPRDFSTHFYLAYVHEAAGDLDAALKQVRSALALEPESAEANSLLGKLLVRQGNTAAALEPLERAVKKAPDDGEKRYLLARAYQQLGRRDDASREFAEIQKLKARQLEQDRALLPKP